MKKVKKIVALMLAAVMMLAMGITALAQDVTLDPVDADNAMITINNAAKGETYTIYKLFDATVTGTKDGSIAYQGEIPSGLENYFSKDSAENISATDAAWKNSNTKTEMSDGLRTALAEWTKNAAEVNHAVSDGSTLNFKGLPYGYYVVTSTQGSEDARAITVTSTNPNAEIYDKNSTEPSAPEDDKVKDADHTNVNIGDTVTYTVKFNTANYTGAGENAKQIVSYTITDTLPSFLLKPTVTAIYVDDDHDLTTENDRTLLTVQQFDNDKKIVIDWDDEDGNSLYKSGTMLVITYTATVADTAQIAGAGNKNEVTISWTDEDGNEPGEGDMIIGEETIYTYAIAIKKVSDEGESLSDATFQLPFYVSTSTDSDGYYIYAGAKADGVTAPANTTDTVTTPENGEIVVKGVANGTYSITETEAPDGYNKLTGPVDVTAEALTTITTNTTKYIDAEGNVIDTETEVRVTYINENLAATPVIVVNKTGSTLPSTGGMGTTIFYILGGILVLGAAVLLVTRRRMRGME